MLFKVAPAFMSGIAKLLNTFGFSQNRMNIVAKANYVRNSLFPELKLGLLNKIFSIIIALVITLSGISKFMRSTLPDGI